ncbi:UDP-glucose 4-epimerase GalE [Streptomyces narbonensis]
MTGLQVILEAAAAAGVKSFLFSSSASVYGMPDVDLVTEDTECLPLSPYGETKLVGEWMARAAGQANGLSTACLRYFNVAGAAAPELADTGVFNLVPMVFERLDAGEAPRIFGDDYPTPDGTCIRDYIHVADIADAHLAAARALVAAGEAGETATLTLNIGRGEGVSVREMVNLINEITGHSVEPLVTPRRPGDPARVVASAERIESELSWKAQHDVRAMISSAWEGWGANRAARTAG